MRAMFATVAGLAFLAATPVLASPQSERALAGALLPSAHRLTVTSAQFAAGGRIPESVSAYGQNHSPALAWSGAPASTKSFALIAEDPDASGPKPFVHWVVYGIPGSSRGFAAGALPAGARTGANGAGKSEFHGPHPPADGDHHYHFEVFALDRPLGLAPGADREALIAAMRGHVLAEGDLVGLYRKPGA